MAQDITPGSSNQSTNTMNPRNLSAASAGSVTPTIISQSNADRRRRMAAEREARRRESLTANVERAEVEREYQRLREEERKANERAEARKKSVEREKVWYYSGGFNSPLKRVETTLGEYMKTKMSGASKPFETPAEYSNYLSMDESNAVKNINSGYEGLNKLADHINSLLKTEAQELAKIEGARRSIQALRGSSVSNPATTYTPMSEEARAAHERLIKDESTSPEMRAQLKADLDVNLRNMQEYQARGGVLSAEDERYLSEDVYRGGSNYTREQKDIAGRMLAAAGSRYDVADFNRSASSIQATQLSRSQSALEARYRNVEGRSNDIDSRTKEALRVNQQGAAGMLSTLFEESRAAQLTGDRSRYGYRDAQGNFVEVSTDRNKTGTAAAGEAAFARQDAAAKERLAVIEQGDDYVNSILKVSGGLDLSSSAFFGEQVKTEKRFGSEWASAGGETAEDAMRAGKDATGYSRFKGLPDNAGNEYILVGSAGKQRYTLRTGLKDGGFAVYGWSGDLVSSGTSLSGLADALKDLDVPFDEKRFNAAAPEKGAVAVRLAEMTDISGIDTAATYRAELLGTLRSNESVQSVESERRAAEKAADVSAALGEFDKAMNEDVGYSLRIQGAAVDMPMSAAVPGIYTKEEAQGNSVIKKSDLTIVKDPEVEKWFDDTGKAVGGAVGAALAFSPIKQAADSVGLTRSLFKEKDNAEEDEEDFIVFNRDSVLSVWAGSLNEFGDMVESSVNDANKVAEKLTGRAAITTDKSDPNLSLGDILSGISDPRSSYKMFGDLFANSVVNPDLMKGNSADLDHYMKLKRTIGKQVIETPKYGAGILTVGDSILSSGAKGGAGAAMAAGAFWASQAGEGIVSQGIHDPEGLLLDLEAGAVLGTVTGIAAKPIVTGVKQAAKVGARGSGLIYPKYRSIPNEGNVEPYSQSPRSLTIEMLLDNPGERFTVSRVERVSLFDIDKRKQLSARRPSHPDPNDYIGGEALHVSFGSPNVAQKVLEKEGLNVNVPGSTGLFADRRFGKTFRNRVLILEDLPSFADKLSESEIAEIKNYVKNNIAIPDERQKYFHNIAQEYANELDVPVLEFSPKTYNFIGGQKRPRGMATDAENELGIVIPNNKKGMRDPKTGELNKILYYRLPKNKRFVGFDERYGIPIYKANFGKDAKRLHLPFPIENIRDTIKDTGISKIQRGNKIPSLYSKSNAVTDAYISADKILKITGKKPMSSLDELAYGSHGEQHSSSVYSIIESLSAGSANPEIKNMRQNLKKAMAYSHDSFKLGEKEMFIPHAERSAFLIREGFLDKPIKDAFDLNEGEFKVLASAVEKHTKIKPGIVNTIRYRPTATDKILATADRLDLVRFGVKPNPKKLFIEDVINEPWSAASGQLLPPPPKKGSFDLNAFIEQNSPKGTQSKAETAKTAKAVKSDYKKYSNNYAAFGGVGSASYFGGMNANRAKISEIFTKENKEGNNSKGKEILKTETDNKYLGEGYKNTKYEWSKYYRKNTKYARGYGYGENYRLPKIFGYGKDYKSTEKKAYGGYNSKTYEIQPYAELTNYNPKNYINPAVYEMKAYDGKPYESKDYSMSGYQKTVKDIFGDTQRARRRSKDRKEQRKKPNYNKFRIENTEIPIVRADEALFGKKVKAFELPANKRTLFVFGNTVTTKKPSEKSLKKKRRR